MKTKKLLALCLALAMTLLCCACTKNSDEGTTPSTTEAPALTASQVVEKMQEALKTTPCSKLETVMDMTMTIDAGESGKVDMDMKNTTEMTISQDPVSSYAIATVDMDVAGETTQSVAESYAIVENNEIVSYVKSSGIWMKATTGQTPEAYAQSASNVTVDITNASIDETITQWNGKEVITLKFDLTGDTLQETVDAVLSNMNVTADSAAEIISSVDYTKLKCSVVLYLDAETYLPLCEEQIFEGMTEVMAPVYEQLGATVDVTRCTATATFVSYEAQAEITLPDGAAELAEAWTRLLTGEPDNGDGTFTIREGAVLIDLVHPDGFEVSDKDYDHVTFKRDDYRQITFTMSYITREQTLGSGEYFLAENDDSVSRWTTLGGGKVSREQVSLDTDTLSFACDLIAVTWETGREDAYFYAWCPIANDGVGTYYLFVEVTDGANDGLGFSKSADITAEEFVTYLNAASPSKVTVE